jgi:DNA-binding XRE family transcriptional regulator
LVTFYGIVNIFDRLKSPEFNPIQSKYKRSFIFHEFHVKFSIIYSIVTILNSLQFGQLVRQARKKAALTQAEAAALCAVSVPFLSHLESGKPTIQLEKALHVAAQLGLRFTLEAVRK